jgi:carbon-monoxide dehydrogenase small subunit
MAVDVARDRREGEQLIRLRVNGRSYSGIAEPRTLLSDFLRHTLGLTGTHVGCELGVCGAWPVRNDGRVARSCIVLAIQAEGAEIETVEGMSPDGEQLHPIQQAYHERHGLQCGFCTPGLLLTTQTLLEENPDPSDEEIREYLSGNVCRCTGYVGVIDSVRDAAVRMRGGEGTSAGITVLQAGQQT